MKRYVLNFAEVDKSSLAVVGVDDATHKIHDGEKIRVDGTRGIVEVLH